MGPIKAIVSTYANMLNFTGRARRAEYWWFFLWAQLVHVGVVVGIGVLISIDPSVLAQFVDLPKSATTPADVLIVLVDTYVWHFIAANVLVTYLPSFALTTRRLHDTDRSGWWQLIVFGPFIGGIWLLFLLCLPGTHGPNRFGGDSVKTRAPKIPSHPAFAEQLQGEAAMEAEAARRAAAKDYYRRNVLASLQKA